MNLNPRIVLLADDLAVHQDTSSSLPLGLTMGHLLLNPIDADDMGLALKEDGGPLREFTTTDDPDVFDLTASARVNGYFGPILRLRLGQEDLPLGLHYATLTYAKDGEDIIFPTFIIEVKENAIGFAEGGDMDLTVTRIRITAVDDVSEASTLHGLQIGPDAGANLRMDVNEIMAENNGSPAELFLQSQGQEAFIRFGAGAGVTALRFRIPAGGGAVEVQAIQGSDTAVKRDLSLLPNGGVVSLPKLRPTSTAAADAAGTGHAFQIGADDSSNLKLDRNEISAFFNGAPALLVLQGQDADVAGVAQFGSSSPGVTALRARQSLDPNAFEIQAHRGSEQATVRTISLNPDGGDVLINGQPISEITGVESGSFFMTLLGGTDEPEVEVQYRRVADIVMLFIPAITETNSTSTSMTAAAGTIPTPIRPTLSQIVNGATFVKAGTDGVPGNVLIQSNGRMVFSKYDPVTDSFDDLGWPGAGSKGLLASTIMYMLL